MATCPDYAERGGDYISRCQRPKPEDKLANDDASAKSLWNKSCQLTQLEITL
ncbi:MAG: hypothetical protein ACJAYG_000987 [Oceanicoccus sp.]|jgi:hypothetical protein